MKFLVLTYLIQQPCIVMLIYLIHTVILNCQTIIFYLNTVVITTAIFSTPSIIATHTIIYILSHLSELARKTLVEDLIEVTKNSSSV